jgi:hypothetical protein
MLQVIGLGYPRTGTMSLKHALEVLQLGPCYHMIEVFDRPGDVEFWLSALANNGQDADWDTLFEDFQSTSDCPACYFRESLWRHFPDAKYILTVRDADTWYDSFRATVYEAMTHPERAPDQQHLGVQNMARKLILETMFEGRFEDRQFAIDRYQAHNQAVLDMLPQEKLLIFDVAAGWEPLCMFLDVDVPDSPFPRSNTRAEFQERFAVVPPTGT